ncbi:cutinase family protein [Microbispora siamensis]
MRSKSRRALPPLLTLLVVLAWLTFGQSPAEAAPGNCTSVNVVGLRGSGEPFDKYSGMGPANWAAYEKIHDRIPDARHTGIPYQAVAITPDALKVIAADYWESIDFGSLILNRYLDQEIDRCPAQRIILLGYSQGAHLVGDMLPKYWVDEKFRSHIAAVVLFGDPRFNPDSPIDRENTSSKLMGIWPSFNFSSPRIVSSAWFGNTRSYCSDGDWICNFSWANVKKCPLGSTCGHFGYDSSGVAAMAGAWAGNLVRGLPPLKPTPSPKVPSVGGSQPSYLHRVYHTCANGACGLILRSGPSYSTYRKTRVLRDGDVVRIVCQTRGESVSGKDGSSSNVWDRLAEGDYAPDFYIDTSGMTGAFSPPIPVC